MRWPEHLHDVLAAMTTAPRPTWWRVALLEHPLRLGPFGPEYYGGSPLRWRACQRWRHADVAEAWEALQANGLAPSDDDLRSWWCEACGGEGGRRRPEAGRSNVGAGFRADPCRECSGPTTRPLRHATLASVASLGVGRWLAAEELARVVEPGCAVEWRAMCRAALAEHHARLAGRASASPALLGFSRECASPLRDDSRGRWPEEMPREHPRSVAAAWPALRALALTTVHLVDHRPGGVTLAAVAPETTP